MIKRILSILLVFSLVFSFAVLVNAEEEHNTKLYTIYADDMLFKHSEEAIFAGTGKVGDKITAELYHGKKLIASGESTVGADGKFTVSFMAPEGSYTQYAVMFKENGEYIKTLKNIVFGELWLASGQSNMMYPLVQAKGVSEQYFKAEKLSPWLRVLLVPGYPQYKGENALTRLPVDKQDDITDAFWVTGENTSVYNMSAVAYYFAEQMMEKFQMPVGILNSSLGGSSIASWLSREACEADKVMTDYLAERGQYVPTSKWNEKGQDVYLDVTANYNQKIHPLKYFRPTGMIWYQGETDISWTDEMYGRGFDIMQKSFSTLFGFGEKLMPIIYTQLAPYNYGSDTVLSQRNDYFTKIQKTSPQSRAVISIHDLPLTYIPEVGVIHPEHKKEVGERMFMAAEGLVYGKKTAYTVATVKNTEIRDGSVYITFENIGDGLKYNGNKIIGFAVCDEKGVYVQADAQIVSTDTVKVWSDEIKNPVSASYAYCVSSVRANLYATENGELALPVGPFVTNPDYMTRTWKDIPWADCEDEKTWFIVADPYSNFYDTWTCENAKLTYTDGYLNITAQNKFTISPAISYVNADGKHSFCNDAIRDLSVYGTLTFSVRNNGESDVTFDGLKLYKNTVMWYSPEVNGSKDSNFIIPADGEWHTLSLDLNTLYLNANECGAISPNNMIDYLQEIYFCFSSEGTADLDVDTFRFSPEEENTSFRFEAKPSDADNFWEFICAMFVSILGIFF